MGETVRLPTGRTLEGIQGVQLQEVFQHGTIGDFIGSSLEGVDSGFIRCVYNAKNQSGNTVTLLCEKWKDVVSQDVVQRINFGFFHLFVFSFLYLLSFVLELFPLLYVFNVPNADKDELKKKFIHKVEHLRLEYYIITVLL
ncbi:hypothetical protein Mgra_00010186 [Meloidogyne graminicola]|uniref:Uncharacterized protein n=1 Tax=Meloidogyne graminicola TaxID=189291 RepID=A0A8S9ZA42_9BILA|nr:hypothetical protein Mgra_00010186 [Meloidogyne graminicola]KAF7623520.1 hypothetical protein Mgra_00010186 [Meloidogyne graminicola]